MAGAADTSPASAMTTMAAAITDAAISPVVGSAAVLTAMSTSAGDHATPPSAGYAASMGARPGLLSAAGLEQQYIPVPEPCAAAHGGAGAGAGEAQLALPLALHLAGTGTGSAAGVRLVSTAAPAPAAARTSGSSPAPSPGPPSRLTRTTSAAEMFGTAPDPCVRRGLTVAQRRSSVGRGGECGGSNAEASVPSLVELASAAAAASPASGASMLPPPLMPVLARGTGSLDGGVVLRAAPVAVPRPFPAAVGVVRGAAIGGGDGAPHNGGGGSVVSSGTRCQHSAAASLLASLCEEEDEAVAVAAGFGEAPYSGRAGGGGVNRDGAAAGAADITAKEGASPGSPMVPGTMAIGHSGGAEGAGDRGAAAASPGSQQHDAVCAAAGPPAAAAAPSQQREPLGSCEWLSDALGGEGWGAVPRSGGSTYLLAHAAYADGIMPAGAHGVGGALRGASGTRSMDVGPAPRPDHEPERRDRDVRVRAGQSGRLAAAGSQLSGGLASFASAGSSKGKDSQLLGSHDSLDRAGGEGAGGGAPPAKEDRVHGGQARPPRNVSDQVRG
jgi:hypothetical protein